MTLTRSPPGRDRVTVGLVQINNSFSGQNYLPYSVGLLQAFAQRHADEKDRYRFLVPIHKRPRIADAVDYLADADIVGFSTYVWNGRISLEIARRIKERRPEVIIVFGGPHVPDQSEPFLRDNPCVDVAVHGEGERTFLDLLEGFPDREPLGEAGVSFLDRNGRFVRPPPRSRLKDLDDIPSPFLEGTFDPLMAANPDETWIGLWETNRGCPFRCTYCDWGSATAAKVNRFGIERLYKEMDWFSRRRIEYIFCCDANFGILQRDVDIAEYVAGVKARTGYPVALSVQNTKNATERAYLTQKILADAGLNKGVAISMQSVDETALVNVKRDNISLESYLELQRRFTRDRIETYSDLILALPGETYRSFVEGVGLLMETGQHNRIQFNNLAVLPNTEMADPEYRRKFGLITVESEIINIHGQRLELDDDVAEVQELVVGTAAMPPEDWRRVRSYCWMAALLHFDKLFQIPLIVAHEVSGLGYRDMIEAFMDVDAKGFPLLAGIRDFFLAEAHSIQEGGPEYTFSKDWLGIFWPADEYVFIELTALNRFDAFYAEAGRKLLELIGARGGDIPEAVIDDALVLNRALVKRPFVNEDVIVELRYNLLDFYMGVRYGETVPLKQVATRVEIDRSSKSYDDFQDWCREIVWWGNKKGAYLYGNRSFESGQAAS